VSIPTAERDPGAGHRSAPVPASPPALDILVVNWLDRENPQSGGAETHLHEVFGRLVRWGHRVTLLCSGFAGAPQRVQLDGIEVHRTGRRYSFALAARPYFRRHLSRRPYDVVVEDLNKVPLFTPRWTERPVVLLVHHLFGATAFQEAALPLATATWLMERPVPRAFRGRPVIAVSGSTKEDLVSRGLDPALILVVPNGIELDALAPDPSGERFPEPTALYLGRVKKYKRVDLPLRAIALLRDRGLPGRLLIAGRGDHLEELRALARQLRLGDDRAVFLGFVDDAQKLELFRRSWVHVLTSPKEGWGIANLEAAASGTPTVASDSPGLRDSVEHGRTGYLVPHGDVEALADRLGALLGDPHLRDELGRQARAFAAGFSWDASARGVLEVLRHEVVQFKAAAPSAAGRPPREIDR
jgi:glycosyltransferase involved in cell wall biosynthesis